MEKKNTILLTVIAVATLLVAVVGATFAYYSLSNQTNFSNTSINATTELPGTITGETSVKSISLNLSAADMGVDKAGTLYYATENGTPSTEPKNFGLLPAKLQSGSDTSRTYTCTATLTLSGTVTGGDIPNGDAVLTLTPSETVTIDDDSTHQAKTINITTNIVSQVLNLKYNLSETQKEGKIDVAFTIKNTDSDNQQIAGRTVSLELTPSEFNCTMDEE